MDKTNYASTLKSEDTEEWFDLQFTRPIGYYLAYAYQRIKVSPNGVTLISIILGIGAGICFYSSQLEINFIGMALLILANLHDSADGQLARLTGKSTRIGRILDGIAGDLWFITIYISLCLRLSPMDPTIWFVAIIAGISHVIQAAMADYHRNIHLLFVYGRNRSEIESSDDIERKIICRYQISEIYALHLLDKKYKPSETLQNACKKYENDALWVDDEIIEWEEE